MFPRGAGIDENEACLLNLLVVAAVVQNRRVRSPRQNGREVEELHALDLTHLGKQVSHILEAGAVYPRRSFMEHAQCVRNVCGCTDNRTQKGSLLAALNHCRKTCRQRVRKGNVCEPAILAKCSLESKPAFLENASGWPVIRLAVQPPYSAMFDALPTCNQAPSIFFTIMTQAH